VHVHGDQLGAAAAVDDLLDITRNSHGMSLAGLRYMLA
jgi:hypothetical protein